MNGADTTSRSLAEGWSKPESTQNTRCKRVLGHPSIELREAQLLNAWPDSSVDDNNLDYTISSLVRLTIHGYQIPYRSKGCGGGGSLNSVPWRIFFWKSPRISPHRKCRRGGAVLFHLDYRSMSFPDPRQADFTSRITGLPRKHVTWGIPPGKGEATATLRDRECLLRGILSHPGHVYGTTL